MRRLTLLASPLLLAALALGACETTPSLASRDSHAAETSRQREAREAHDRAVINATLDRFHRAAAEADEETYFGLLTEDAVFLGTDDWERWPKPAFEAWAAERFEGESAWTYVARDRSIDFSPSGEVAWFDETVVNEKYGAVRGTGVLLRTEKGWRIAQYNLTFTVPNEIALEVVEMIRVFDAQQVLEAR